MEAFEQFVALALESEGLVVSEALKFPVRRRTRKSAYAEFQTHGYEVDLVAARRDALVLVSVKSFFGSRGVVADHVIGRSLDESANRGYAMFNNLDIRNQLVDGAASRFGYDPDQVEMRLYVGKFAGAKSAQTIREWFDSQIVGGKPISLYGAEDVVATVRAIAESKTYRDNAVLSTLKVLAAAGALN